MPDRPFSFHLQFAVDRQRARIDVSDSAVEL